AALDNLCFQSAIGQIMLLCPKLKLGNVTGSIIWQLWTTYASNQPSDKLCFFVQNSSWVKMYKVLLVSG
ncbi:MAG: hypothetical protein AAFQ91_30045, partial [Cyanobacteria bacterium J06621_15]